MLAIPIEMGFLSEKARFDYKLFFVIFIPPFFSDIIEFFAD